MIQQQQNNCSQCQSEQNQLSFHEGNPQTFNNQNKPIKKRQTKFNKDRRQTKRLINQLQNIIKQQKNTYQNQAAVKASYQLNKIKTACQASLNRTNKNKRTKRNCYQKYCEKIIKNKFLSFFIDKLKNTDFKQTQQVLNKEFWEKYQNFQNQQKHQYTQSNNQIIQQLEISRYQKEQRLTDRLLSKFMILKNYNQLEQFPNHSSNEKQIFYRQNFQDQISNSGSQQKRSQQNGVINYSLDGQFGQMSLLNEKMKDITQQKDSYLNNKRCPSLNGSDISKYSNIIDNKKSQDSIVSNNKGSCSSLNGDQSPSKDNQDQNNRLMYNIVGTCIEKFGLTRTYSNRSI